MFGGVGTIALIIVMRVLIERAWHRGIGLTLSRRLLIPLLALAIGAFVLRDSSTAVLSVPSVQWAATALVVTLVAAAVRALSVQYSNAPASREHPHGVRIRSTPATLLADIISTAAAAAVLFLTIAPVAGLAAAGGSLTVAVSLGDMAASLILVVRGRPASLDVPSTAHTASAID